MYTKAAVEDYLQATLITITQLHQEEGSEGDVLVFLTGQEEIESMERMLNDAIKIMPAELPLLLACPMYGALAPQEQLKAFAPAPPNTRKVNVLSCRARGGGTDGRLVGRGNWAKQKPLMLLKNEMPHAHMHTRTHAHTHTHTHTKQRASTTSFPHFSMPLHCR